MEFAFPTLKVFVYTTLGLLKAHLTVKRAASYLGSAMTGNGREKDFDGVEHDQLIGAPRIEKGTRPFDLK